jgi:uncharacterized membrane protein
MFKPAWRVVAALALMTAVGCGDDDGNGPEGSISVTASPSALTVQQGASGTVTVTLTRGGGFADPVNVTVEGLPAGVTATVSPTSLTGTTTSATVTVNVASTVAAGTYTATIRASATGVGAATVQYTLTVTATPNYALTATPATLSIGQGGSGTATIGVQRTSFTDPVALTLVNPPAGITGTFNPASATGDQSILTLNVASTVATGPHTITVQGAATGPGNKTTTIALTVTPPGDYTLTTTPATLSIPAGANATTTVNINRTNNLSAAVTLSLDSPPAGITATFNPAASTTNSSVATINVASTVVPGSYNVTISGSAPGIATARTVVLPVTVTTAAAFSISATPNALTVGPGASGTSSVAIVRTNFTTDVALSVLTNPQGITGTFTPATLTGTTLTSSLALNVPSGVAAGTYPVTVQGVGGTLTQSTTINVTVPAPNVGFSVSPTSLSLAPGGTGTATLNIARTAFATGITPTVTGNPAGLTVTFNPAAPITANTSTMTVNVGSGVAPGTYQVVIAATGVPGNPSVTLPVTVTPPGGGNITWEFCSNEVPLKFWRKSNGTWAEVTGTVVGAVTRFLFSASGNDAGIAFTSGTGSTFFTFVMLATSAELGTTQTRTCGTGSSPATKTFNVSGMQPTETGVLGYGPGTASLSPSTPSYNVEVAPGTYDWMASYGASSGFPIPTTTYTHYNIGRNEAAPGGAVTVNRANASQFVSVPFTVTGGAGGSFYQFIQSFQSARGSMGALSIGSPIGTTASGNMLFLATADRQSTDLTFFSASSTDGVGTSVTNLRQQTQYFGPTPPASATFALPTAVPAFTVTQPSSNWTAAGSIPAEYQTSASTVTATFQGSGATSIYSITATRNWLVANSMSTNYTIGQQALPNFLPAWQPGAPLTSSSVTMLSQNFSASGPIAGSTLSMATRVQQ